MSVTLFAKKKAFNPSQLFAAGEQGVWYDPSDWTTLFQDSAGTTPVTAIEQPVGLMLDKSGRGNHASQPTTTSRPILRNRYNLLVQTATLSTQNVTTRATSHKLSFSGAGTITLSGTATGTFSAGTNTFTATAGTLTLTVSGTVTEAMLTEANDVNVPYQWVTTGAQSTSNPVSTVTAGYDTDVTKFPPYLFFDGTDDWLQTGNINFSATNKISAFYGARRLIDAAAVLAELSANFVAIFDGFALLETAASRTITYGLRGNIGYSTVDFTDIAAPTTKVASIGMDKSLSTGEVYMVRVNAVTPSFTRPFNQDNTNNFGNHPLYIGARYGTTTRSLFFFGRIYSLIVRGALTSSPQLEQTETWVAGKTGVTL